MIEDRDYMRSASAGLKGSVTVGLILTLAVVFVLQETVLPHLVPLDYLVLSLDGLRHGFVWQLLTFQMLHAGWLHLIFNSIAIYFFGRPVEYALGRRRWLTLYFLSGIIGGLVQMLCALLLPWHFAGPVVGASAGGAGLIAAFAVLNWNEQFTLLLYFIPVTLRGKTLFGFSLAFALIGMAAGGGGVAHAAHLGGLLAGFALVRWGETARQGLERWRPFHSRQRKRQLVKVASIRTTRWPDAPSEQSADLPSEEFISREVDPILDKISAHGIQSLTERERKILEKARHRMAKR